MLTNLVIATAIVVLVLILGGAFLLFRREDQARALLEEARATGTDQVASLHPVIDLEVCISSGACVDACPEDVLGQVDGKTYLVQGGSCIGHGRCAESCPVNAISLVFGTAQRGVDIPLLRRGYETNKNGIFVIGELGGMGLIRNAMRQGAQVVETIREVLADPFREDPDLADVLIVGAGPAGISCALHCVEKGLTFRLLEQYILGGSVTHFPRRKLIFSEVIKLPIVGRFGKAEMLKEELIAEFERVVQTAKIDVLEQRRVKAVKGQMGNFRIEAEGPEGRTEVYRARTVVLSIGRRGTPRKLGAPGEELSHVVYRLLDAEQYRRRRVLVVGGGDSAVEAAVSISGVAGAEVHLSYRGDGFFRVKKKNRESLASAEAAGKVIVHLKTNVTEIRPDEVELRYDDGAYEELGIDDVIVQAGGVLPTPFLEEMGIRVETKHGERLEMETTSERLAKSWASTISRASERLSRSLGSSRMKRVKRVVSDDMLEPLSEAMPSEDGVYDGRSSSNVHSSLPRLQDRAARAPGGDDRTRAAPEPGSSDDRSSETED
jgi:thioredoxin reductase/ferredoxin